MKKIVLLLLAMTVATSCLQREDQHSMRTAYGAAILYAGANTALNYGDLILTAVEMDITAQTPMEKRDSVADLFFTQCKFRISGDRYVLVFGDAIHFEITTDGQPLTTPGAKWEITRYGNTELKQSPITISCLTPNSWKLETEKIYHGVPFEMELASPRRATNISPRSELCKVSFDNSVIVDYSREVLHSLTTDTSTPLVVRYRRADSPYYYQYGYGRIGADLISGTLSDDFKNPNTNEIENVEVEFIPRSGSTNYPESIAEISYGDFTDTWFWSSIPYYNQPLCCF